MRRIKSILEIGTRTNPLRAFISRAVCVVAFVAPLRAQTVGEGPVALTVEQAIAGAIETNLATRLAQAESVEARGRVVQANAALLPQLLGAASQSRVFKSNLAVEGFTASPLIPNPVIGPYDVFDARIQLVQRVLDMTSIWRRQQASANARASALGEQLAAEQVATAAALAYIEDLRAIRDIHDAQSNLALSRRLAEQAAHQHDAGLATAVDVVRADARVAIDHQSLIQAQLTAFLTDLRLKRLVGRTLASEIALSDPGEELFQKPPDVAQALAQARSDRIELRITRERLTAETYGLSAAKAGYLPTVSARADYGFSGNTPGSTARTGSLGGSLEFPVFDGSLTRGKIEEARGLASAARSQDDDAQIQVEEDVRQAVLALSAEKDDVDAAEIRKSLAERELDLAHDRYSSGAGDNIQVVAAQASLADALKSRTDARARYADSRVSLAAALGRMRSFQF
jgi:outer membrane protein TolC